MKLRKMLPLLVVLVIAAVSIFIFFIFRSQHQELATPPESSEPIAELKYEDDTVPTTIRSAAFSQNGRFLVSGGIFDKSAISLWDVSEKRRINSLYYVFNGTLYDVNAVTTSADGKWLAGAGKHVKLWNVTDIRSPVEETTLKHNDYVVWTVDFSPNGKLLAAGDQSGKVKLWDIHTKKAINLQHNVGVLAVNFSPDGELLAAGDQNGTVTVWNIQTKKVIKTLNGDSERVLAVRFSPKLDNPILAAAGKQGNIKLWNLSDWQLYGTIIYRATVEGLAFSKNGKVLASAGKGLELWSVKTGAHIISLKGHTDWVTSVAFSSSGTTLASSWDDRILRVWDTAPYMTSQKLEARPRIRTIYFLPRGRPPQPYIRTKIDKLIKDVQKFYADEMERHGFGRKTFNFEKDENGRIVVYRFDGEFTDDYYIQNTADKVREEIYEQFDKRSRNVWLIVVDISSKKIGMMNALGGLILFSENPSYATAGHALIPASDNALNFRTLAHELGHAFGLEHDFREHKLPEGSYIMSYDYLSPYRLSKCAAEWLDKSCLFNQYQKFFNELPTIERLTDHPNTALHQFKVEDTDEIHQVQLTLPTTIENWDSILTPLEADPIERREVSKAASDMNQEQLHDWKSVNGQKTVIIEFELPNAAVKRVTLRVIDLLGNIAEQEFNLSKDAAQPPKNH